MPDANVFVAHTAPASKDAVQLWRSRLATTKGDILPTTANALIIFAHDPELRGMLAYNAFASRAILTRPPPATEGITPGGPFPRAWEEADRAFTLSYLQRSYTSKFKSDVIASAMIGAATMQRMHPVEDYLASLEWDGEERISHWLANAFGCVSDAYHQAVGAKFLMAAVRRIKSPGCKFDSILILEGAQDIGKSRACRELFGGDWFTDNLPSDLLSRHMSDALQGVWGVEFAEIEHLLRAEPEAIKAFLSRPIDRYLPPYGRMHVERPRQCVFVGTTNSDDYARDSTGNRRLWPVKCMFVDVDWICENRDQLWAEACALEDGTPLWLEIEEVRAAATAHQAARHDEDAWEDGVLAYCVGRSSITIPEILMDHLSIPKERQDRKCTLRVANILKRAGWRRKLAWEDGKPGRRWERKT